MAMAKIQTVKGLRVEVFLHPLRKNTTRPIDCLDSRDGHRTGIDFSRKMCYTLNRQNRNMKLGELKYERLRKIMG